jgi:repressor LexA
MFDTENLFGPEGEEQRMEELTDRQKQVLHFIVKETENRGFPPTIREIGEQMSIRSTNGVNDHLNALERKGYLKRGAQQSRSLVVTKRARLVLGLGARKDPTILDIPLLGRVAAGAPLLATENVEDSVRIDSFLLGGSGGREVFALRVKGDSMIGDGIFDGDFLFVRKAASAQPGAIVVALIEDEATVKRYYPEQGRIRFQPSNPAMEPIYVTQSEFRSTMILGVVVGVYRKMV